MNISIVTPDIKQLEYRAARCRRKVVRMVRAGGAGHMGGAMSCLDVVAALYFYAMRHDPRQPQLPERDRFILSAGHKSMALYAALAEAGYFDESILDTYGKLNTKLPGHPDMYKLPGVEANTGALGHGLSIAVGMALGFRLDKTQSRVFVVLGDGELPEGSNWEAAAAASHHKLDNLVAIVDWNGLQISGATKDVMNMEPIGGRFNAFGWSYREIDGNNMREIVDALDALPYDKGAPSVIVARTIKAKGLSFAENRVDYHYWKPKEDELRAAEVELDHAINDLMLEVNALSELNNVAKEAPGNV